MNKIFECPTCFNSDLEADYNYCDQCGTDLKPYRHEYRCCGKTILPSTDHIGEFCPFCGMSFDLSA